MPLQPIQQTNPTITIAATNNYHTFRDIFRAAITIFDDNFTPVATGIFRKKGIGLLVTLKNKRLSRVGPKSFDCDIDSVNYEFDATLHDPQHLFELTIDRYHYTLPQQPASQAPLAQNKE